MQVSLDYVHQNHMVNHTHYETSIYMLIFLFPFLNILFQSDLLIYSNHRRILALRDTVQSALDDALAELATEEWVRVKFRTGGKNKESYPSPVQLANALKQCIDLEIEFKLTAGLHEPISHLDKQGVLNHGFLNVLMATSAAFQDDASVNELAEILDANDPSQWSLKKGLSFAGKSLGEEELNNARSFFGSFGSCSIEEPLRGLQRLQ